MPDLPSHRQFFGDADRDFRLTPPLILELERVTGSGIGGLSRRFFAGDFRHQELLEVIRLGLVGGGEGAGQGPELPVPRPTPRHRDEAPSGHRQP